MNEMNKRNAIKEELDKQVEERKRHKEILKLKE
jgi:hypothetical protein